MTKDGYLEQTEIHELALIYAHAEMLAYKQSRKPADEDNSLNVLVKAYKDAMGQIQFEEK